MAGKTLERTEAMESLAVHMYKHMQYSPKVVMEKLGSSNYTYNRLCMFFTGMRNYVKNGTKNVKQAPKVFYDIIQECMDKHVSQLTPRADEKARVRKPYTRKEKTPIKVYQQQTDETVNTNPNKININPETLEAIKNVNKVSGVGIKVGSNIKLFDNEDILTGYLQCLNDLKPQLTDEIDYQVIDLSYKIKG